MITVCSWRGAGHKKYRVLAALEARPRDVEGIWRLAGCVGYAVIGPTLNDAQRKGLVIKTGERMRYRYHLTPLGHEYLATTRRRFL